MNKITIPLSNDYKLIVEKNTGEFDKEVFVGIENPNGAYWQDLVIIRPTYKLEKDDVIFNSDSFELLVFGDADIEDYTEKFTVGLHKDEEWRNNLELFKQQN